MKGLRIRPEYTGLRASLFDLEAEIMEIVWEAQWDEFSVSQVQESLAKTRELAYTTVMTTVSRLFDKELLKRRKVGRKYMYRPAIGARRIHRGDDARGALQSAAGRTTGRRRPAR